MGIELNPCDSDVVDLTARVDIYAMTCSMVMSLLLRQ